MSYSLRLISATLGNRMNELITLLGEGMRKMVDAKNAAMVWSLI